MYLHALVNRKWFVAFAIFIPVVSFALYIYKYAVNVPYMDDKDLIESFNMFEDGAGSFLSLLIEQQNEHRIAFSRLGVFLSYLIAGTLDFRIAILIGFSNLILLGFSLFLMLRAGGRSGIAFLPIALLLFSPIVYQVHLWSITAFQTTASLAFSILCLNFLRPELKRRWIWSIVFAAFAGLTNLDGASVMVVGVFWLFTQKRWSEGIWCSIFLIVYLILYFLNFRFNVKQPGTISVDSIPLIVGCFLTGTGSLAKVFSDTHRVGLSIGLGSVMILTILVARVMSAKLRGLRHLFSFDFSEIVFLKLLLSMAIIALGRYSTGIDSMTAVRFSVYSVVLVSVFYALLFEIFKKHPGGITLVSTIVAFMLSSYSYLKYESAVNFLRAGMVADTYNYPRNGMFLHQYLNTKDPDPSFYKNYIFPVFFKDSKVAEWSTQLKRNKVDSLISWTCEDFAVAQLYPDHLYATRKVLIKFHDPSIPLDDIYLIIMESKAHERAYIVALRREGGNALVRLLRPNSGVSFSADLARKVPAGDYIMALAWDKNGKRETRILAPAIKL